MENLLFINKSILIVLLVGTGVFLTLRLMFIQLRYLSYAVRIALGFADKEEDETHANKRVGDISYFQALTTALSATVGIGNIVGVAGAILIGGPGALFWLWVTALVGMATKYSESMLAVKYREKTDLGYSGGPMYYIERALKQRWLGVVFAVLTVIAALGIGNIVQINAAAAVLAHKQLDIATWVTSISVALVVALVILGGIKRIGRVASILTPFMALLYFAGCTYILVDFYKYIPRAFQLIYHYAFNPMAAGAGTLVGLILITVQQGVSRSLFSNEAGMGSAPIAAASAKTDYPVKQGLVSMLGPFIDTIIICTMTGLVIVIGLEVVGKSLIKEILQNNDLAIKKSLPAFYKAYKVSGGNIWPALQNGFGSGAAQMQNLLTAAIFTHVFGPSGHWFLSAAIFLFAFSTILGWYFYGDRALVYLKGEKIIPYYKMVWISAVFFGGMIQRNEIIWEVAGLLNALMAYPNLVALLALSPVIVTETKQFFRRYPHRHDLAVRIYVLALKLLPKNSISKTFGFLAQLQLPRFFMIPVLLAFSRIYRINVKEAELELKDYKSLNKFFTRALKNGSRIVDPSAKVIVSPVDGTLLNYGDLDNGTVVQTKGIESKLQDLLGSKTFYRRFLGGKYVTIYLAPKDYHRIHSPCEGKIVGYYYQPGKLFPVNEIAVETINRLFSRNERLITYIETEFGLVAVVKVGATSVGKIKVTYDEKLSTNRWFRIPKEHFYDKPIYISKGAELGRFEMGSTVMLLFENKSAELLEIEEKQKLFYGQPIATFTNSKAEQSKPDNVAETENP